jgi:hypothetical protein
MDGQKGHRHVPMRVLQTHIRATIALQGFALCHVLASEHQPAFSYTVGLHRPGTRRPELLISGLKTETRVAWLCEIGFRIQGPPPLHTCQYVAQIQGVPLQALRFPAGGLVLQPGKRYFQWDAHGLPTLFAELGPEHYETHLGQALVFHQARQFPCLQLIWPDSQGIFPWEPAFEARFHQQQELLFDVPRFVSSLSIDD